MNVVECIPYRTFKERIRIVKEELRKGRYIEVWDNYVYSAVKWRRHNEWDSRKAIENFKTL